MQRNEFLAKLYELFPTSFSSGNKQAWLNAYREVLPEHIDYEELIKTVYAEYEGKSAPAPAWCKKHATYNYIDSKNIQYKKIEVIIRDDVYEFWYNPEKESFYQAKENLRNKFKKDKVNFVFLEPVPTTDVF